MLTMAEKLGHHIWDVVSGVIEQDLQELKAVPLYNPIQGKAVSPPTQT